MKNRLTLVRRVENVNKCKSRPNGYAAGLFQCECGNKKVIQIAKAGKQTKSCGCIRSELAGTVRNKRHGLRDHWAYRRWVGMNIRCLNSNSKDFPNYGGRGIQVYWHWSKQSGPSALKNYCDWIDENLGPPPTPSHQIDRIDNNRGYFPDNIRWATPKENCNNRRSTV